MNRGDFMNKRRSHELKFSIIIIFILFLATACVPGDGSYTVNNPAGLLSGVWHGWIAPISLILSIFNKSIRVYEVINTGFWYDFGFYIAIISGFGGISFFRNKKKK